MWNTVVIKFLGGDENDGGDVSGVVLRTKTKEGTKESEGQTSTTELNIGAAFIAIGHDPNTKFLKKTTNLNIDSHGYVVRKNGMSTETSIEGIFAAGDVTDATYRQAVTSAGSGAQAALDAERWLSSNGMGI